MPVEVRTSGKAGITEDSTLTLFVQDYAEEATMNRQSAIVVVDKAKLPELIQKKKPAKSIKEKKRKAKLEKK